MTPLLTRWVSQDDYGTFDLIFTYVTLLIPFVTLDCGEATFRFLVDDSKTEDDYRRKIISSSVVVIALGLTCSLLIGCILFIFSSKLKIYIPIFIVLLISETFYQFSSYLLRGFKQLPVFAMQNILFVLIMSSCAVFFVKVFNLSLDGMLLAYSVAYILSGIYALSKTHFFQFAQIKYFDLKLTKEMLKFSLPLMPNAISWWIINVSDRSIVSAVLGTANNAIYAVANKIPGLCQTLFGVFHLSWQENAIETLNAKERDVYFSQVFNKMVEIMGCICILMIASNFLFYKIVFTQEYFLGYFHAPILVVSIIFSMMAQFLGGIYIARMESKKNGITTTLTAIINLTVCFSLIKIIGLYAASVSTFVAYFCLFIIRYIDIRRSIKISFSRRNLLLLLLMMYYFGTAYLNNTTLNILNFILSIILTIAINYNSFLVIAKGTLNRLNRK